MVLYFWCGNDLKFFIKYKFLDDLFYDFNVECLFVFVEMVGGRVIIVGVVGVSIEFFLFFRCFLDL